MGRTMKGRVTKHDPRCAWCRERVHRHEGFVEYGWTEQYGEGQAVTHRGACSRQFDRVVMDRSGLNVDLRGVREG
jgi:hypothetical protein